MRILAYIGVLAILAAVAAGAFLFGGFFNVATNWEDPKPVAWAIVAVREASVHRHAPASAPVAPDAAKQLRDGARAFLARGCTQCHGGPGVEWAKFAEGMNPSPPDLKELAGDLSAAEIFWVAKNGIRMTGMPGFAGLGAEDAELWAIAAFVKKLPDVTEAQFKEWTSGG